MDVHARLDRMMRTSRSDRWGVIALLGLVVGVTAWVGIVGPVLSWLAGDRVRVPYVAGVEVPSLEGSGLRHGIGTVDLLVPVTGVGDRLLDLAPGVAATALAAATCWLLLGIVRDLAAGDPFRRRNATRLWAVAMLVAIGIPVVLWLRSMVDFALLAGTPLGEGAPGAILEVPWPAVVAGAVTALLAEAFATGSRLRDDVEGLV